MRTTMVIMATLALTTTTAHADYPPESDHTASPQLQDEYPTAAPEPAPAGKWRLGATFGVFPAGKISHRIVYRGETLGPILVGDTGVVLGGSVYVELLVLRYFFVSLSVQLMPSIKWHPSAPLIKSSQASGTTPSSAPTGTAREYDLLPTVGALIPLARQVHFLAFAAPGYSFLQASGLVANRVFDAGMAHGFVVQAGTGLVYEFNRYGFFGLRVSYQWGFQKSDVTTSTSGAPATIEVHSRYLGVQASGGYCF